MWKAVVVVLGIVSTCFGTVPTSQWQTLMDLYQQTEGSGWIAQPAWNISAPPCGLGEADAWTGVTCGCACPVSNASLCVIALELNGVGLDGVLPNLSALEDLSVLSLTSNRLRGSIPALPNQLHTLWLSNNFLEDGLDRVSTLPALRNLSLASNVLRGELDDLPLSLNTAYLSGNSLDGSLDYICSLEQLEVVDIASNNISGSIPGCVSDLPLFYVNFEGNLLNGTLPALWPPSLAVLMLAGNNLSGPLEDLFGAGEVPNLQVLSLRDNAFVGLPLNLTWGLGTLDLSGCNLSAYTTETVAAVLPVSIVSLDLSNTGLGGALAALPWSGMWMLTRLYLENNALTGTLPSQFDLPSLTALSLADNQLSGPVPAAWMARRGTPMQMLNLVGNGFNPGTGGVPAGLAANYTNPVLYGKKYSCPGLVAANGAQVLLDPAYYNYALCRCSQGRYGLVPGCMSEADLCLNQTCFAEEKKDAPDTVLRFIDGFYPSPSLTNVERMLPCSTMANDTCTSSQLTCQMFSDGAISCQGVPCAEGYSQRLCSMCNPGYYLMGSACNQCDPNSRYPVYALSAVAVLLVFVVLLIVRRVRLKPTPSPLSGPIGRGLDRMINTTACELVMLVIIASPQLLMNSPLKTFHVDDNVILGVLGLLLLRAVLPSLLVWSGDAIGHENNLPWVNGFLRSLIGCLQIVSVLSTSAGANAAKAGDVTYMGPLSCFFPQLASYSARVVFGLSLPWVLVVFILLGSGLRVLGMFLWTAAWRGGHGQRYFIAAGKAQTKLTVAMILMVLNVFAFPATLVAFAYFSCHEDHQTPSTLLYSSVHPYIQCYDDVWWNTAYVVAVLYIALWLGIAGIAIRFYRLRKHFAETRIKGAFHFFYEPMKRETWWYEIVVLVRRFFIAMGVGLWSAGTEMNTWLNVVLVLALIVQVHVRPSRFFSIQLMEIMSLGAALILAQYDQPQHNLATYVVLVYAFVIVLSIGYVIWSFRFRTRGCMCRAAPVFDFLFDAQDQGWPTLPPPEESRKLLPEYTSGAGHMHRRINEPTYMDVDRMISDIGLRNPQLAADIRTVLDLPSAKRTTALVEMLKRSVCRPQS